LLVFWLLSGAVAAAAQAPADGAPADTVRLSLEETLDASLEVSPEVDQREAQRRRAEARHAEARASRFLTDMSLSTAHSFAPSLDIPDDNARPPDEYYLNPDIVNDWSPGELRPFNNINVVARQPLLTWGELSGSIRAARHAVDVESAGVERKALEVTARTGELYYNLLLTRALDRLASRTRDVIDRAKREVKRLLDEGDESVDQADLFQVRLTEQEYRRRVVEINQRTATARTALRRQLFLPDSQTVAPATDELSPLRFSLHPDSLSHYLALGMANRPELEQARAGIAARKAQVEVERSDFYPKLGFQATYGFSYTFPERPRQRNAFVGDAFRGNSTRTGFGLQMNLNFGQTRARVEQARAQLNEVRHQQEAARQLVRFEVEQAYRDLIVARSDMESRDRDVTITGEWLRTEQINFDLDLGDTENLVEAVRANLEAEARYFEAVKRYNVAVLRLLEATGTLTDRVRGGTLLDSSQTRSGE
jgi:outer membrane protein TolC